MTSHHPGDDIAACSDKELIRSVEGDETEDEEVKLNCFAGYRGFPDSDFSSDSEDEYEESETEQEQRSDSGVVKFSCHRVERDGTGSRIICPKPERLSPHQEESMQGSERESSSSSVGAQGAPMSLGGSNDKDSCCDPDHESDDESGRDSSVDKNKEAAEKKSDAPNKISLPPRATIFEQFKAPEYEKSHDKKDCRTKRVLSSNTLAALNAEAGRNAESLKRLRAAPIVSNPLLKMPELSLGLAAVDKIQPIVRDRYMSCSDGFSSDDDEELDKTLSEELKRSTVANGDMLPVPLLTPNQSPQTIPSGNGRLEWPSNLVVDSVMMTAATITRPLSPKSLQKLEEDEEIRLKNAYSNPDPTSLTPLLRSIYVGID